jgi:hypothetical protein
VSTAPTQFVARANGAKDKYMTSTDGAMKRQMRETWEMDVSTYEHGVNAVDWYTSK